MVHPGHHAQQRDVHHTLRWVGCCGAGGRAGAVCSSAGLLQRAALLGRQAASVAIRPACPEVPVSALGLRLSTRAAPLCHCNLLCLAGSMFNACNRWCVVGCVCTREELCARVRLAQQLLCCPADRSVVLPPPPRLLRPRWVATEADNDYTMCTPPGLIYARAGEMRAHNKVLVLQVRQGGC